MLRRTLVQQQTHPHCDDFNQQSDVTATIAAGLCECLCAAKQHAHVFACRGSGDMPTVCGWCHAMRLTLTRKNNGASGPRGPAAKGKGQKSLAADSSDAQQQNAAGKQSRGHTSDKDVFVAEEGELAQLGQGLRHALDPFVQANQDQVDVSVRITHVSSAATTGVGASTFSADDSSQQAKVGAMGAGTSGTASNNTTEPSLTGNLDRHAASLGMTLPGTANTRISDLAAGVTGSLGIVSSTLKVGDTTIGGYATTTFAGAPGVGATVGHLINGVVGVSAGLFAMGDASYRARVGDIRDQKVDMTYSQETSSGVQATAAVGIHGVGASVRAWGDTSVRKEYTAPQTMAKAQQAMQQDGAIKRKLQGLKLQARAEPILPLQQAGKLEPGASVAELRQASQAYGASVSLFGVHFGRHQTALLSSEASVARSLQSDPGDEKTTASLQGQVINRELRGRAYGIDVPLAASATDTGSYAQATSVKFTLDPKKADIAAVVQPEKAWLGAYKSFVLPALLTEEQRGSPRAMRRAYEDLQPAPGVRIDAYSHRTESSEHSRVATAMPLLRTITGSSKFSLSQAQDPARYIVEHFVDDSTSQIVTQTVASRRSERFGKGAVALSSAYIQVDSLDAQQQQEKATLIRASRSLDQGSAAALDEHLLWLKAFVPASSIDATPYTQKLTTPLSLQSTVTFSLTAADKLKIFTDNLLPGFSAERAANLLHMPLSAQGLNRRMDQAIATSLKADTRAAQALAVALKKTAQLEIHTETDLAEQISAKADRLQVRYTATDKATKAGVRVGANKQVAQLHRANKRIETAKKVFAHPVFAITPKRTQEQQQALNDAQKKILALLPDETSAAAQLSRKGRERLQAMAAAGDGGSTDSMVGVVAQDNDKK